MSSQGRTRPLSRGRGGGRCLPTLPGEIRPGNAANLDLTDSTHLSVWSSCPGFMLASLASFVYLHESVICVSVILPSATTM